MAIGIKTRLGFRDFDSQTTKANYWAGSYTPIVGMKSVPSPFGDDNMVDTSTIEDWQEMQEKGRASAAEMEIPMAFTKAYKDAVIAAMGKPLNFIQLYGTDGKGKEGIVAFNGEITSFKPDEASEDHLTATVKVAIKSLGVWIENGYTATVTEDINGYPTSIVLAGNGSATAISLDKATATVEVGGHVLINATTVPAGGTVTWTSSDETKATVSDGLVTGLAAGSTTITATFGSVSATCTVTVSAGA